MTDPRPQLCALKSDAMFALRRPFLWNSSGQCLRTEETEAGLFLFCRLTEAPGLPDTLTNLPHSALGLGRFQPTFPLCLLPSDSDLHQDLLFSQPFWLLPHVFSQGSLLTNSWHYHAVVVCAPPRTLKHKWHEE